MALAQSPSRADSQSQVRASTEYNRSGFWQMWFGEAWRDVWGAQIEAPVLDLRSYAGGLKPFRQGGNQTRTLHFHGADGRRYVFRSTDKNINKALPDDLQNTPIGDVIQDQTSSFHPTGHLVVAALQEAAGLLIAPPRLVLMPDDPRLGEFRSEFAHLLGQIEERPDDPEGGPVFAGAEKVSGADKLLENLDESMEDRLDSRDYLKARLIDFMVGDPDRGGDQWEFAKFEAGERDIYRPIPRDRDYAFMKVNGLLMRAAASLYPKLVTFGETYPSLQSLVFMTREFDRSHLVDLDRAAWDAAVKEVQQRLTNDVIDRAVARLPDAHRRLSGARLVAGLRARRDALPTIAAEYYAMVNQFADVFASDEHERAEITRNPDGSVTVQIWREGAGGELATNGKYAPAFQRRFVPAETDEIRVFLERGNDRAVVRGASEHGITVRVIGGEGDDVLLDSATVASGGHTHLYDASGRNTMIGNGDTRIVRKAFVTSKPLRSLDDEENAKPAENPRALREERRGRFKDLIGKDANFIAEKTQLSDRNWGSSSAWSPVFGYAESSGIVVGFGPTFTEYGFRKRPHAWQLAAHGMVGLSSGDLGIRLHADRFLENSRWSMELVAHATQLEANRFFGYGNDSEFVDRSRSLVTRNEVLVRPAMRYTLASVGSIAFGPTLKYVDPNARAESPAAMVAPLGMEPFAQVGAHATLTIDESAVTGTRQSGFGLELAASGYPAALDVSEPFGEANAVARLYVPLGWPTLALRAGGQRVWGPFPLHEAAFIGGSQTLRGFYWNRFAGDAAAFGSAELRAAVARITLLTRGDLGVIAFSDAGRVWLDGESAGDWHTSVGGGLWFASLGRSVSVTYAKGEQGRIYVDFGLPF